MSNWDNQRDSPRGRQLLELPEFNRGTGFTRQERIRHGLLGLLPYCQESMDRQLKRAYRVYAGKTTDFDRYIFLRQLQDANETLFLQLVMDHTVEMLPVIYTPTVGEACQRFSEFFQKPNGLFLNYPERDSIDEILENVPNETVEVIVITDGESILGIGDQGVGGMGIPIGKLSLYSALGGVDPATSLPVVLDVGTDNEKLLNDPNYLGWRNKRLVGQDYDDFMDLALMAIHRKWPNAVVQFEDFGPRNSQRLLEEYFDRICCFNDDIQGTAAITLGCLLAASRVSGKSIADQTIVIAGAGAAGTGIAQGCLRAMIDAGLDAKTAKRRIYMLNRDGLIHSNSLRTRASQKPFIRAEKELKDWKGGYQLLDVIRNVRPDVLIGVTGQFGFFTEEIVREMADSIDRPCIFPLSNPTANCEAMPEDLIRWTNGRALIATGSPFEPVFHDGVEYSIAQCNNAYVFPGVGLGLIAAKAKRATEEMFVTASKVIGSALADVSAPGASLLPGLEEIRVLSREIAVAVAKIAIERNLSEIPSDPSVEQLVDQKIWYPVYDHV